MSRLAIRPGRPDEAWHCFDDLAELIFAFPQCLLSALERRESGLFFGLLAFICVDSHLPPAGFVLRPSAITAPMANSFAPDALRQAILSPKLLESHGPDPPVRRTRHHRSAPSSRPEFGIRGLWHDAAKSALLLERRGLLRSSEVTRYRSRMAAQSAGIVN
jgi:hypothetical protein